MSDNIHMTQSNSGLLPLIGNLKRILCPPNLPFCAVYNHEKPKGAGSIEQKPTHNLDEVLSLLDC